MGRISYGFQSQIKFETLPQWTISSSIEDEEIKWYERAKTMYLLLGDDNTQYLHMVTNGKHRKSIGSSTSSY